MRNAVTTVRILCLSYGERGESERLWKIPGMTVRARESRIDTRNRRVRRRSWDAEIRFFDMGDYPIVPTEEKIMDLVNEFRLNTPEIVLTHSLEDPYNPDHPMANDLTLKARVYAQASGYPAAAKAGRTTRRRCSFSSRTSPSNAISNRRYCWILRRYGRRSWPPCNRWLRKSIWYLLHRSRQTARRAGRPEFGDGARSSSPKPINASTRR